MRPDWLTRLCGLLLLLYLGACAQRVDFPSAQLGTTAAAPTRISGYLAKPDGNGPFPAVVLLHGCGGIAQNEPAWREWFRSRGVVALSVDGFGDRGVSEICTQPGRVDITTRIADAFGGLDYIAAQPFVDPNKVAVMGFSNGASVALGVAAPSPLFSRPKGSAHFHDAIALYPECLTAMGDADPPPSIPVLVLSGALDDWTPASTCQRMAAMFAGKGAPIKVVVLPGAQHAFDNPGLPSVLPLPNVVNINSPTGFGATIGSNVEATARARQLVAQFLALPGP